MANEKKQNGQEVLTENATNTAVEVETTAEKKLTVEREVIKDKDGKQYQSRDGRAYFAYVVRGVVRGREVKVDFAPKDKGGYEPLDIVFDVAPKADLIMTEEEMTNDSGKKTKYMAYKVRTVDEGGIIYECGVKPSRDSDKSLLSMLLNTLMVGGDKTKTA